jgi:diaminopimelate decarboxylase
MYDAVHRIMPVQDKFSPLITCDIAGPVCESSDIFVRNIRMQEPAYGDLMAIMDAGAYGFSMASPYNSRPLPAEVLVDGGKHALIRHRQTFDDMIRDECTPDWDAAPVAAGLSLRRNHEGGKA